MVIWFSQQHNILQMMNTTKTQQLHNLNTRCNKEVCAATIYIRGS